MTTSAPSTSAPTKSKKFRNACLTLNNYSEAEYAGFIAGVQANCTYGVCGKEVGETGTPHLQCYVEFTNSRHVTGIKKALGSERYHVEPRQGTAKQASDYCKKDDPTFYENGELSAQGTRTDWASALQAVRTMPVLAAIEAQPQLLPMVRALERVRDLAHPAISRDVTVHFVQGLPGVGKTYWCNQKWPGAYMKPSGAWWDNYNYESVVILDDVEAADMPRSQWLRILEGYPLQIPVKGGYRSAYWKTIVITSNYSPRETFGLFWDGAMSRRLHKIYDMNINPPLPIPCPSRVAINAALLAGPVVLHDVLAELELRADHAVECR